MQLLRSAREKSCLLAASISAVAIAYCLFGNLGAVGLIGPDDPRYAWIARAMAQTGDWITPRLYGQPWFEKPVLYYWLAAIGFRLHLPDEWAARLPSAFAALAAAVAIAWLARRYYSPDRKRDSGIAAYQSRVTRSKSPATEHDSHITIRESALANPALLASLLWATSVAAIGFSRAATPDMLFAASLTLAMVCAARSLFSPPGSPSRAPLAQESASGAGAVRDGVAAARHWPLAARHLLFGAFLGLAVLAKGPAGLILAAGAILLWALLARKWRAAFRLANPLAVLAFCAVALPWYILCALRNPGFFHVFIVQHNFQRYLTPVFHHRQPFWFFGPILLLAIFPWTALLLPLAALSLVRILFRLAKSAAAGDWERSLGLFVACWVVFPVLFFSFSESKLPSYILPSIPPLSLLLAVSIGYAFHRRIFFLRWAVFLLGLSWAIPLLIGASRFAARRAPLLSAAMGPSIQAGEILAGAGALLICICAAGSQLRLGRVRRRLARGGPSSHAAPITGQRDNWLIPALAISAAAAIALVGLANISVLPRLDPYLSARSHAQFLRNDPYQSRVFTYQLPRDWNYGLAFYFHRQLPDWNPADPAPALVLTTQGGFQRILASGRLRNLPWVANQSAADLSTATDELGFRHGALLYIPIPPLAHAP